MLPERYQPKHPERTMNLLNPESAHEVRKRLRASILGRFMRLRGISKDPRIVGDQFFRWQSVASFPTFYMLLDVRSKGPERNIMFEPDVHELLEILPAQYRDDSNFGARLVEKLWPPAYSVVNSNTMLPLSTPWKIQQYSKRARACAGKIVRRFSRTSKSLGSWAYLPHLYLTDPDWFSFMNPIFTDASGFPEDIFNRENIRECWRSFCSGEIGLHADIEKLLQIYLMNNFVRGDA
jgi:hypothetical protein